MCTIFVNKFATDLSQDYVSFSTKIGIIIHFANFKKSSLAFYKIKFQKKDLSIISYDNAMPAIYESILKSHNFERVMKNAILDNLEMLNLKL